jgi:hypothetical protein
MGDVLGLRKTIFVGGIFTLVGQVASCTSFQLLQPLIGRIITSVSIVTLFKMVPVRQAECSKPTNRGKYVVVDGIFMSSGSAAIYRINSVSLILISTLYRG